MSMLKIKQKYLLKTDNIVSNILIELNRTTIYIPAVATKQ